MLYPPAVYPLAVDDCPDGSFGEFVRSPTSVALASELKGNLSIILFVLPPLVYPFSELDWPAKPDLSAVKSPTSVALASVLNGNLSIVL